VELNEELGLTMIVVTHNMELASMMHRTLRLVDGQLKPERVTPQGCEPIPEAGTAPEGDDDRV
jgi:ABC-type lipoprotein export system ATPase subunit